MANTNTGQVTVNINAPVEKVWLALTDSEIVKQYFFGTHQQSDWKKGSDITWTGEWEGKSYKDKGKIIDIIPNKKLQYTYLSSMSGLEDKPENYQQITIDLEPQGNNTVLHLTQQGNMTDEQRDHSASSWKMVFDGMKKVVEV